LPIFKGRRAGSELTVSSLEVYGGLKWCGRMGDDDLTAAVRRQRPCKPARGGAEVGAGDVKSVDMALPAVDWRSEHR
jgi:hypothetical protein